MSIEAKNFPSQLIDAIGGLKAFEIMPKIGSDIYDRIDTNMAANLGPFATRDRTGYPVLVFVIEDQAKKIWSPALIGQCRSGFCYFGYYPDQFNGKTLQWSQGSEMDSKKYEFVKELFQGKDPQYIVLGIYNKKITG